ncbi:MAG: hypothetical protein J6D03_07045 [Clostridia bacterium]|nr:hypothetical protein [Clostridia bacterium]
MGKIDDRTNILPVITEMRNRLQISKKDIEEKVTEEAVKEKVEILNNIIEEISKILEENNSENEKKNIGELPNKYNYEKYGKCYIHLEKVYKLFKDLGNIEGYILNQVVTINISTIEELMEQVKVRIKIYDMGKN